MKHLPLVMAASASVFALAGAACSDDDGGTGGGSGTGATGGSSGATGGTGGTAGAAGGTGGSGATGGAGGRGGSSGSAGTGGSSSGGTGGTTGDRCTDCLERECSTEVNACQANTACTAILECVIAQSCGEIPEPDVCIEDCITQNESGRATFQPLSSCVTGACFSDCSGS